MQETHDSQGSDSTQPRLQEQSRQEQSREGTEASNTNQATASVDVSGEAREQTDRSGSHTATQADLQRLEQEFVHDVYNAIAPHFSATRFAVWPKVRVFWFGNLTCGVTCGSETLLHSLYKFMRFLGDIHSC